MSNLKQLTPAEQVVHDLIVTTGAPRDEIAGSLRLSVRTIDFHFNNILRKLKLRSRSEVIIRHYTGQRPVGLPGIKEIPHA